MKYSTLKKILYGVTGFIALPFIVQAGSGLPNPLNGVGVTNLQTFFILLGNVLQQLGIPFLVFAITARAFWFIILQQGGKPEDRKEFFVHLGFICFVGLILLTAPAITQIIYNTCKALGGCP